MFLIVRTTIFFLFTSLSICAFSVTSIIEVKNELPAEGGEAITVILTGAEFGERPNVVYYNDFRRENLYTSVSSSGQLVGQTNLRLGKVPMVASFEDTPGFYIVDDTGGYITFLEAVFESQSKIFLSYSAGIPTGKFAPLMSEPRKWSEIGNWKMTWIMQSSKAYGIEEEFDLCGPTLIATNSALQGNSSKFVTVGTGYNFYYARVADWWAWDTLNHMQVIFDGNTTDPQSSLGSFSVVNKDKRYLNFPHDTGKSLYKGPAPSVAQINFPGWYRAGTEDNFQALYSNIYVAGGSNFLARIEVTDSADYVLSKYRRTVFPKHWNETEIRFDIYKNEIRSKGTLYLHYFNSLGERVAGSYKACPSCPLLMEE